MKHYYETFYIHGAMNYIYLVIKQTHDMKKVFLLSLLATLSLVLISCEKDCISPQSPSLPEVIFKPDRDKLIAEYLFSKNYQDSSGNGYHLGVSNYINKINPGDFNNDGSFNFVGKNGFNTVSSIPGSKWSDEISVSLWINPSLTLDNTSVYRSDFISNTYESRSPFQIFYSGNGDVPPGTPKGSVTVVLFSENSKKLNDDYQTFSFPVVLEKDRWYHILMTAKTSGDVTLYINGVKLNLGKTRIASFAKNNGQIMIGYDRNMLGANKMFAFSGKMDDIRIYGRIVKENEIKYFSKERN